MDPKRILLIRLDRIGDVMLSTPAIKALREKFPSGYLAFMVGPHAADLVKNNPYLDEVIVYDKNGTHKNFLSTLKFAFSLKKIKFDIAICLHPTMRTHLIAFLAGIPRRIGYDRKGKIFLTEIIHHEKEKGLLSESQYVLDMLKPLGINSLDRSLYIKLDDVVLSRTRSFLKSLGIGDKDIIVTLHPGASSVSKKWPIERFAGVADYLVDNFKAKVIVVSGKDDAELSGKIMEFAKNKDKIIDLSGKTTIMELASVLKLSRLFISNDSGPVHISVAVGTPVISIFGRIDPGLGPKRWGPTGINDISIQKDAGCKVCLAHNCTVDFKCLKVIEVADLIEAIGKFKDRLK